MPPVVQAGREDRVCDHSRLDAGKVQQDGEILVDGAARLSFEEVMEVRDAIALIETAVGQSRGVWADLGALHVPVLDGLLLANTPALRLTSR